VKKIVIVQTNNSNKAMKQDEDGNLEEIDPYSEEDYSLIQQWCGQEKEVVVRQAS